MKHLYAVVVCLCFSFSVVGQTPKPLSTIPNQNLVVGDKVYTLKIKPVVNDQFPYEIIILDNFEIIKTLQIQDLDIASITTLIQESIAKITLPIGVKVPDNLGAVSLAASSQLVSGLDDLLKTIDPANAPKCLEVYVNKHPTLSSWNYYSTDNLENYLGLSDSALKEVSSSKRTRDNKFGLIIDSNEEIEVESIELNIKDGILLSVSAIINKGIKKEVFISASPMSISHRSHLNGLKNIALVSTDDQSRVIILNDIITIAPFGDGGYTGIRPGNVSLVISGWRLGVKNPIFKEQRQNIFDFRVYSDFIGLVQTGEPNGLIQGELSKRLPMNRDYKMWVNRYGGKGLKLNKDVLLSQHPKLMTRMFSHVDFLLASSKIQDELNPATATVIVDSANLEIGSVIDNPEVLIDPLSPVAYQVFSSRGDLSVFHVDIVDFDIKLDIMAGIGITGFNLTRPISVDNDLNYLGLSTGLVYSTQQRFGMILDFNPERRYGFKLNASLMVNHSITEGVSYSLLGNEIDPERRSDYLLVGLDTFYEINEKGGKVFLRLNRISPRKEFNKSHVQLQFGYSMSLMKVLESSIPNAY